MKNALSLIYAVLSYTMFLGVFIYSIGFIGNIGVTNSLDSMPNIPVYKALIINVGLLGVFAVQHSVMARPWFKQWITRHIPRSSERATYVLFSNLAMILLFMYWEPMGGIIWQIESELSKNLLIGGFAFGWIVLLLATFLINHFQLFGLMQPWRAVRKQEEAGSKFVKPMLYKIVRHPIYLGWLIIFWCAPTMTAAHLVFTLVCTAYIFIGIYFEEADLVNEFGATYEDYQKEVPMVVPFIKSKTVLADLEKASH
ncbi:MAG: methanethiol S-methyltransferase [Kangiellaceae bacterium]